MKQERYSNAAEVMKTIYHEYPSTRYYFVELIRTLTLAKKMEEALAICQEALEHNPINLAAFQNLASLYFDMEHYEKALETAKKGLKVKPDDEILLKTVEDAEKAIQEG